MTNYLAALSINTLRLQVRLGVGEPERQNPQPVELGVRFYFTSLPSCTQNDLSSDFICYDKICSSLIRYIEQREFHLIEYLCLDIHREIRGYLEAQLGEHAQDVKLWIRVHKCEAPVAQMIGGASFVYSDLPLGAQVVAAD